MATTPNYGWVMPDPTDFVTNLPADFEIFGDAVDTTLEAIETKLDVITTEGDLIVGDASGDPVRLPVGTAGQVLTSDGDTVAFVTASGGAPNYYIATSSNLYAQGLFASAPTNLQEIWKQTVYIPIFLPNCTVDRIGFFTAGNRNAISTIRLGIYGVTNNKPSTLILDAGTVAVTSAATTGYEITVSQTVTAGLHYLAFCSQDGGGGIKTNSAAQNSSLLQSRTGLSSFSDGNFLSGYTQSDVAGAFANAGTIATILTGVPNVQVRIN